MANYARGNAGPHALIEMDEAASDIENGVIVLSDVAPQANVNKYTGQRSQMSFLVLQNIGTMELLSWLILYSPPGGRGIAVGPILSATSSDIFCDNENGPNFLFRNNGDGTFKDVAAGAGERPGIQSINFLY